MEKFTLKQMFQISHALGIDLFKAVMSHRLKDKVLPIDFYRNRFQKDFDETFEEIVLLGFAVKTKWQDMPYYYVTDSGLDEYRKQYADIVEYKKPNERDLQYLKNRINFYCSYRLYRFCDDNSNHVISAYLEYWINKYRVSHTTEDVICRFKSDLKQYHKKGLLTKS